MTKKKTHFTALPPAGTAGASLHRVCLFSARLQVRMSDEGILRAIREKRFAAAKRDLLPKLQRFPEKLYYKALNAYYLQATGSPNEALEQCDAIRKKTPNDAATIDLIFDVYCKLGREADASFVYESIMKRSPSVDLGVAWLDKAVSSFDIQMILASSSALLKISPSSREVAFKVAFAHMLCGSETKSADGASKHLEKASVLIEKFVPLQTNQEFFVYASCLAKRMEFAKAAEVLSQVQHKELELVLLHLESLDKSQNWEELHKQCYRLLFEEDFNDFDTWKYLIKAAKCLDYPMSTVQKLIKLDSRNSYLANVELCKAYGTHLDGAIELYYKSFQSKPCCYNDISGLNLPTSFFDSIDKNRVELLSKSVLTDDESIQLANAEAFMVLQNPQKKIAWDDFSKFNNPGFSNLYIASMIQDLQAEISTSKMIKHIVHLEKLAQEDPENFYIKLWLLNLYSVMGCSSLASEMYDALKIKMIQHDILSYKLDLEPSGKNIARLVQIYRFYLTGSGEITSYFKTAFENCLFTKLEDLYRFGKRLTHSVSKHLLVIQILRLCRILHSDYYDYYNYFYSSVEDTKAHFLSDNFYVSDNRDFDTDYKVSFGHSGYVFFEAERKKQKEYVQLYYLKEMIINEKKDTEITKLIKLFEKWMGNPLYTNALSASEMYFFKIYVSLFKITKRPSAKDKEQQINFLTKNMDFDKIKQAFLSKTSPLSKSATKILVESLELIRVINSLSEDTQIRTLSRQFQQGLIQYVITSPETVCFKEVRANLEVEGLEQSFVENILDKLADGIRQSKFKMK